jgi:intraflagellar transport protein 172
MVDATDPPHPRSTQTPLPQKARNYVLELSMDRRVEQQLGSHPCDACGADTYEANLSCHACGHG